MKRQPLKGLLIFAFFSNKGSFVLYLLLTLLFVIPVVIFGLLPLTGFIIMLLIPATSFYFSASVAKTEQTRWNKFQLSMPVRRKDVIISQYAYFLLLVVLALLMIGVTYGIANFLDYLNILQMRWLLGEIEPNVETALTLLTANQFSLVMTAMGMGSAFLTCAIYYPLRYTICRGQEELTSWLVIVGIMAVNGALTMSLLPWLVERLDVSFMLLVILVGLFIPILLMMWSYFFTVNVYQRLDE